MNKRIKQLATALTIQYGISFLDGAFMLGFSDEFYVLLGFAMLFTLVWLMKLVYSAEFNQELTEITE
jgi:hypothetical protein